MTEDNLRNDSVWSLIAKFSIPAIIGMLVSAIYNIVDRIFIGQYVGEAALASLMVVFPIIMVTFALSVLIGQGGSNLISISLGKGDKNDANRFFTNTVVVALAVGIITTIILLLNIENMLYALGASGQVFEDAKTYLSIYLYFSPLQTFSFVLSTIVRAEGLPKLSMVSMISAALTNIVLDYLFIGVLGYGVAGGAIATGIGQTVGLLIILAHFVRGNSSLIFDKKNIIPHLDTVKEIVVIGFPSFLSTVSVAISMLFLNSSLNKYGGVEAIAAMSAINSLFTVVIMPINGIQGGIQPIIGFNHGAKLRERVKETIYKAVLAAMAFSCVVFAVIQLQPKFLLALFIDPISSTMPIAITGLRIFMLSLPFLAISVLSIGYFQATQKPKIAIFLGLLRQFILLIPILLILPKIAGLTGVWASVALSDYIAIFVSIIMLIIDFRHEKQDEVVAN